MPFRVSGKNLDIGDRSPGAGVPDMPGTAASTWFTAGRMAISAGSTRRS